MMTQLHMIILTASVALIVGCDQKGDLGPSARSAPGIHVAGKSPNRWSFEYTTGEQDALSLWMGKRDSAGYLLIPGRNGVATLTATEKELVLEAGGNSVSQVVEGFAFAHESTSIETDGSIIIGQCNAGPVGIRITKMTEDAKIWEPAIYSATHKDDGVVIGVVLLSKKKIQFYAGENVLAEYWTRADSPTDVFIARRDGGLFVGNGIISTTSPGQLGKVEIRIGFPDLESGVDDIVIGTIDGKIPLGVRLIPTTEKELKAITNGEQAAPSNG